MFEIIKSDLAGRIGILHTNHGKVETPAFVPVIHPVNQTISSKKIREIGFDLVITNAYITKNRYGSEAAHRGIHSIIDYDGAIMTDSGGYQVLEYGRVKVEPEDMAKFEFQIKTDLAIPLDKPTGFGLPKSRAKSFVEQTLRVAKKTLEETKQNGQVWIGPIQGGEHFELVRKSTKALVGYGYEMLALGSPVEFMRSYEYKLLAQMIIAAKKEMPSSIPLHLFGAGHPLTIPLAVALGCDTFDSASYMLYAKEDRYMTEDRTVHLSKINHFSCNCEVCSKFTPKDILQLDVEDKKNNIALHNLLSIKSEVDRTKEAILEGRLWEYVMKKARSHPKLYETIEVFTKNSDDFIKSTAKFKERAIFLFSREDQFRPEILSFHKIIRGFKSTKKAIVICGNSTIKPYYLSPEYKKIEKKFKDPELIQFCEYNPFLGLIPIEVSDIYPASHNLIAKTNYYPEEFPVFLKTWETFFTKNKFKKIFIMRGDPFLDFFVKKLPKQIKKQFIDK